jgi:hypothetical protein
MSESRSVRLLSFNARSTFLSRSVSAIWITRCFGLGLTFIGEKDTMSYEPIQGHFGNYFQASIFGHLRVGYTAFHISSTK